MNTLLLLYVRCMSMYVTNTHYHCWPCSCPSSCSCSCMYPWSPCHHQPTNNNTHAHAPANPHVAQHGMCRVQYSHAVVGNKTLNYQSPESPVGFHPAQGGTHTLFHELIQLRKAAGMPRQMQVPDLPREIAPHKTRPPASRRRGCVVVRSSTRLMYRQERPPVCLIRVCTSICLMYRACPSSWYVVVNQRALGSGLCRPVVLDRSPRPRESVGW